MAAAREPENADPGRAELYLRLQVETELRRGLGAPRYEQPREWLFPGQLQSAVLTKLQNRRHAMMVRRLRATTGGGTKVVPLGLPRGRLGRLAIASADRIRISPLGRPFRFLAGHLRRLGQFWSAWWTGSDDAGHFRHLAWHVTGRWRQRRAEPTEATSVDTGVQRITGLAAAMTAIGAISEATQNQVLEDYQTSLAIRGMTDPNLIFGHLPWRPWVQSPHPHASGPLRATPVGVVADSDIDGRSARIYLGTLVTSATSARLTFRARFEQSAERSPAVSAQQHQVRARHHSMLHALQNFAATDSLGGSYGVHFSGGGGSEDWRGRLDISPVPPAAVRWLDLSVPGATAPMRIPLDAAPPGHAVSSRPLDPAGIADRYLDNCMVEQIQEIRPADYEDGGDWPGVFELAADLLAAGVLTIQSPSLARLAAVARWLKRRLPDPLTGVEPGVVPAEWLSLLARAASTDGPTGVIPVAAALPVVDGAHCVVTELESEADSMALQVHAQGWPDPHRYGVGRAELFRWSARDDVGGWYTSSESGWSYSDGEADMDLRLRPAANPRAHELQIILTGRTAEASVTVPLNWQPAPFRRVPLK